ncbi:MAG: hypothetical protein Q7K42_04395, partial [Candidatus Diapherotrites archaeon]|nr:hypothetical protein [Candidatus Diapherotrites archaeon]
AIAAKESGDARTAVMLLFRAGEIADKEKRKILTEKEVAEARKKVEEEVIFNMVSTLPSQEQLVLLAVADLTLHDKGIKKISGEEEKGILLSGEVFEEYLNKAKMHSEQPVSSRWYRQYISELETYGLLLTTNSGIGQRGQTRFIKLGFDAQKIKEVIEKELQA